jgi:integrase
VSKRTKIYDRKCPGLYVSITTAGVATFNYKYTNAAGERPTIIVGVCHPDLFRVDAARAAVHALKARIGRGEDVVAQQRVERAHAAIVQGKTVDRLIDEWIEEMKKPVRKKWGGIAPRNESWENEARHLNNYIRVRFGSMVASEVTTRDIARLSEDIMNGEFGKPSVSMARHMRRAASSMFEWAAKASRKYVQRNPCEGLDELPPEPSRERVLSADEIRTLWRGLDSVEMSWDRRTLLAIKFALVTMLRTREFLHIHRRELVDMAGPERRVEIPVERVKKRRVIKQPLSDLAMEIIREAMTDEDQEFVFQTPQANRPLHMSSMATALRGRPDKGQPGICELLGMEPFTPHDLEPFTPHDLRRTAATLASDEECDEAAISRCLDHDVEENEDGEKVASVTGVYNRSKHLRKKRRVLDTVAEALRRIIADEPELAVAA